MTIYTPEQIAAADQLVTANAHLRDVLANEPVAPGPSWDQWNDEYQSAWRAHDSAEVLYRSLFGKAAPNALAVLRTAEKSVNPLRPTLAAHLWGTRDRRFIVGPYVHGHPKAALLQVQFWADAFSADRECADPFHVDATDLEHAQQIVEQITWATSIGARPTAPSR